MRTSRRNAVRAVFITALCLTFGAPAAAQVTGVPPVRIRVVVTPERGASEREKTPAAGDVLSREAIRAVPAESLVELLQELPAFRPVLVAPSGQPAIVSARGFFGGGEAEYVQLRVDGIPVADSETGLADWRAFSVHGVERVETLRGPASSMYGDTALGGVVQLFTRRSGPPAGQISASGGAWRQAALDGWAGGSIDRVRVSGSAGLLRSDGFREHSGLREARGRFSADVPSGSGLWRAQVSGWARTHEEPGPRRRAVAGAERFASSEMFAGDEGENNKAYAALTYSRAAAGWQIQGTAHASWRRSDLTRTVLLVPDVGIPASRATDSSALAALVDLAKRFGRFEWRTGAEISRERLETSYGVRDRTEPGPAAAEASGARRRGALFASLGWTASERVRIVSGLRYDAIDDAFTMPAASATQRAWSPRVGAAILAGPLDSAVTLFAQASRAFKSATLDQLFDPRPFPDFQGGFFTTSNRFLRPQRATNVEVGARQNIRSVQWQAAFYDLRVDDEIDFDVATFTYQNIGRSRHRGVELDATWRATPRIAPHAAYTWTRVTPEGRTTQLKNIPEQTWLAGLRVALPAAVSMDVRLTSTTGAFLDDDNQFTLDGDSRVDFRAARTFGRTRVRLDVMNLLDDRADAYGFALTDFSGATVPFVYPSPGRWLRAGIDIDF